MVTKAITALAERLSPHLDLSNSRLETFCLLVIGMISARTVNLSHLACERPTTVKVSSTYRRLQRFFQYVDLGQDWSAPLVVRLLDLRGSWHLCLDRTNWKIGRTHINILVLAIATKRHRVPLMWSVLGRAGNSNTAARIALMKRYLALFNVSTIKMLLADREFIGAEWLEFLNENNIPFVIRVKKNQIVTTEDGVAQSLRTLLRTCRGPRVLKARFTNGAPRKGKPTLLWLTFAAKRIRGKELLIVVSNRPAHHALVCYKKRWAIESLFGDTKTRGLNIEDTHLTMTPKLDLLLGLVALAVAWASKTASILIGTGKIKRKKHGYLAKSIFRIGFDQLRRLLRTDPQTAVLPWRRIRPKPVGVV